MKGGVGTVVMSPFRPDTCISMDPANRFRAFGFRGEGLGVQSFRVEGLVLWSFRALGFLDFKAWGSGFFTVWFLVGNEGMDP